MVLKCTVCNVNIPSATEMATHVAGRRHRDVVTRADQAARTSFVLDFPSCTRPADLVALFSVYGHVDNVHIGSHKKGNYAFIEFRSPQSVAASLKARIVISGRCLTVRPRTSAAKPHQSAAAAKPSQSASAAKPSQSAAAAKPSQSASAAKPSQSASAKPSQSASAAKPDQSASAAKPSQSASVAKPDQSASRCKTAKAARKARSKNKMSMGPPESMSGSQLESQPVDVPSPPGGAVEAECPYGGGIISMTQQMLMLEKCRKLSPAETSKRDCVKDTISNCLSVYFPDCVLVPFGSSALGLATSTSDLDFLLYLNHAPAVNPPSKNLTSGDARRLLARRSVIDGALLASLTTHSLAQLCARVLRACRAVRVIAVVTRTRCPVLKLCHVESGIACDVSFGSGLSIQNTGLVAFLMSLDQRVKCLVATLRQWAADLTSAPPGARLTNYALMMLVLFYLQTLDRPVLPSIGELMDAAGEHERCTIDGWRCGFSTRSPAFVSRNTDPTADLLRGFFRFCGDLDLDGHVIVMRSATLVDITTFVRNVASDERQSKFKVSPLNLQDPFELEHNVAGGVSRTLRDGLVGRARAAHDAMTHVTAAGGVGRLVDVLAARPPASHADDVRTTDTIVLDMHACALPTAYIARQRDAHALVRAWFVDARRLVLRVLLEVLRFECGFDSDASKAAGGGGGGGGDGKGTKRPLENGSVSQRKCGRTDVSTDTLHVSTDSLPVSTDSLTVSTDSLPVSTDSLPVSTDSLPISTDSLPVSTDSLPVSTDSLPVSTDSLPVSTDFLPISTDSRPVSTDSLPVSTDSLPVSTDLLPVSTDSLPVSTDSRPVSTDSLPVSTDSLPVSTDSRPVSTDSLPVSTDSLPVSTDSRPVSTDSLPVSTDTRPVLMDLSHVSMDTRSVSTDLSHISKDVNSLSNDHPVVSTDANPVSTETSVARNASPIATDCPVISTEANPISTDCPVISTEANPISTEPSVSGDANPISSERPVVSTAANTDSTDPPRISMVASSVSTDSHRVPVVLRPISADATVLSPVVTDRHPVSNDSPAESTVPPFPSDVVDVVHCVATRRMWVGRRLLHPQPVAAAAAAAVKEPGNSPPGNDPGARLDVEVKLSERLASTAPPSHVIFDLTLTDVRHAARGAQLRLSFRPLLGEKQFRSLFPFIKSFLSKHLPAAFTAGRWNSDAASRGASNKPRRSLQ